MRSPARGWVINFAPGLLSSVRRHQSERNASRLYVYACVSCVEAAGDIMVTVVRVRAAVACVCWKIVTKVCS